MKHYLGPWIIWDWGILPYSQLFYIAWKFHDISRERAIKEDFKKAIKLKFSSDKMFLRLMKAVAKTFFQKLFAYIYFSLVYSIWTIYFIFLMIKYDRI
jgi:hypothetical protein